jgi:hypothetical protein
MRTRGTCSTLMLAGLLAGGSSALQAQQRQFVPTRSPTWIFGTGISTMDWLGCGGVGTFVNPALMLTAEHPVGHALALAFTARVHVADVRGASCVVARPGTYISLTDNPLGRTFAATDVRLEFTPSLGRLTPMLGLGGGGLYSGGTPDPYGLVAGGLGFALGKHRIAILGEYQRLRLSGNLVQRMFAVDPRYVYPVMVSQKSLGPGAVWESAGLLAVRFDVKVKTPR